MPRRLVTRSIAMVVIIATAWLAFPATARSQNDWIDAHVHLVADKGSLKDFDMAARAAIKVMNANKIKKMVIMSPPQPTEDFDIESLKGVMAKYGERFVIMGGGGTLNPMLQAAGDSVTVSDAMHRRFAETAEALLAAGAKGFGEIAPHYVSLVPSDSYEPVPADHPLMLLLADIAARHGVPIDLHFDPVPEDSSIPANIAARRNPPVLKANLAGFERLLAHNRQTTIVWAHAGSDPVGFFTPQLAREMLGRHANLSFSIRPFAAMHGAMVNQRGTINKAWVALLRDFPDRFVIGTDSFFVAGKYADPDTVAGKQRRAVRTLLNSLPPPLARRIGYENAERLYKLDR